MTAIVDAGFPGGNALIARDADGAFRLSPDLRDTIGGWFYWCVRLRGAAGESARLRLAQPALLTVRGPALSADRGLTWRWLGPVVDQTIDVTIPAGHDELRLSMGMPYVGADLERFLAPRAHHPRLLRSALCRSRKGREAPLLRIAGDAGAGGAAHRVLITARHHACEMMASYAVEGLVAAALADDDLGRWFAARVELLVAPFMDRDGVEDGDQGKNRAPRDHNRDYEGVSLYPESTALRELAAGWGGAPLAALDLHCPWIVDGRNERVFLVGARDERIAREQRAFAAALAAANRSPIPYEPADDLPFGQEWNVAASYASGSSSINWLCARPGTRVAATLELPYANAGGAIVDQASARAFGAALAAGLRAYLD